MVEEHRSREGGDNVGFAGGVVLARRAAGSRRWGEYIPSLFLCCVPHSPYSLGPSFIPPFHGTSLLTTTVFSFRVALPLFHLVPSILHSERQTSTRSSPVDCGKGKPVFQSMMVLDSHKFWKDKIPHDYLDNLESFLSSRQQARHTRTLSTLARFRTTMLPPSWRKTKPTIPTKDSVRYPASQRHGETSSTRYSRSSSR
ncbi:hypothetical protein FA13DRAFT_1178849 [Coprinellus micaceus]|uniref:Uncharacterized protein n=1 Tax=Coprinellus micaceus TaxID=71717 RepID=A0A4Y7SUJ1_COPMI|nr:hypothetical protein FA13DRAFT_1178849 [Coprinellus micaceus]